MAFKKAYFSRSSLFELRGTETDGVFFSIYALREDRTLDQGSRLTVAPETGELVAFKEAIQMYRRYGAEGFYKYARWVTGRENAKEVVFTHGEARFGLALLEAREDAPEKLAFVIRRGEESRVFPLEKTALLSLTEVLERKAIPTAVEADTAPDTGPSQSREQSQEQSRSREESQSRGEERDRRAAESRSRGSSRSRRQSRQTSREETPEVPEPDDAPIVV